MDEGPVALHAFEVLAERYAAMVDTKPHNAYYERPATLSLLPEVRGKRVLDAGCGPGVYTEWLVEHGAEVVAFDVSPGMVHAAGKRIGGRARVFQADMAEPLSFATDGWFDLVLSALALDYVRDWRAVFAEFYRVLRRPGHLVLSVGHPLAGFSRSDSSYFDTELVEYTWYGFGVPVRVPAYRRPLGALLGPLLQAGFVLEELLEPRPTEAFRQADPEEYEKLSREPGFLCVRAGKP